MNFSITATTRAGVCTVRPRGELDISNSRSVGLCLDQAVEAADVVVVDLTRVPFMDCAALAVLAGAARTITRRGGDFVLTHPRPPVQVLLDVFDLSPARVVRPALDTRSAAEVPVRQEQRQELRRARTVAPAGTGQAVLSAGRGRNAAVG
ncbi:anti-sigma factor antagonist [Kineococcus sp. DHX-1]|uniref:anti-sigma factor antagonist n=1 Tax=Kineococcus sp. DHX-1 TaxID=3349638 RepID=UPI0036D257B4